MFWRSVAHLGLKWRKSNFWGFGSIVEFLLSVSDFYFESWSRSVILILTCVQNLRSIRCGLVGFGIGCRIWKFQVL